MQFKCQMANLKLNESLWQLKNNLHNTVKPLLNAVSVLRCSVGTPPNRTHCIDTSCIRAVIKK